MDITVARADLARALTAVARVVEKRNTIPILGHVLLDAGAGQLTVKGTDLDLEISVQVPASVITGGTITVDAGRLTDIAKKLAGTDVIIQVVDDKLAVKSGRSRFSLATLPASDFPNFREDDYAVTFTADLAELVGHVAFAQSNEQTRIYLCGVHIHQKDDNLVAVATDGHRMAVRRRPMPENVQGFPAVTIPTKTVSALPKGVAKVSVSQRKVRLVCGDMTLVSKLIDAPFPDYERVIPTGGNEVVVNRSSFLAAVERAGCIDNGGTRATKFSFEEGVCRMSLVVSSTGESQEEIDVEYDGPAIEIGFNYRYIADVLGSLQADSVKMRLAVGQPGYFAADDDGLCVCMPMRT